MITLHAFGPLFGLPDPSPFVTKTEVLLKMSGLPYEKVLTGLKGAPKGKLPYIRDTDGTIVADSTLIRFHLEKRYGIDFDSGLTPSERGTAWAFEKLCEDHIYWLSMRERWLNDENFAKGPSQFFASIPPGVRQVVMAMVRRDLKKRIWGQGLGRHTQGELDEIAARGLLAISAVLADKPFLMGEKPCGADATLFAFTSGMLTPFFETRLRALALRHDNLKAYAERGRQRWFPGAAPPA